MKKLVLILLCCAGLFATVAIAQTTQGHGSANAITSLDGDGNGTFMGTFTDTGGGASNHPWYTFDANMGDMVAINLSSDVASHIWLFDVLDNNAQVGDMVGVDIIAAADTGGATANLLNFVAPSTGQFVIQVDSFFGAATVNYTLVIGGSTGGVPPLAVPTLGVWGMVLMAGLLLLVVYRQRASA